MQINSSLDCNNNNDDDRSKLFKRLIHSQLIRNQIFNLIKIINRQEGAYYYDELKLDFRSILEKAVQYGHLPIVEFIHNNVKDASVFDRILDKSVGTSQLSMRDIAALMRNSDNRKPKPHLMDLAAQHGQLEILKFLHINRTEGCSTDAFGLAASNGHLECVKFLYHHRKESTTATRAIDGAVSNGHLNLVVFLQNNMPEDISKNSLEVSLAGNHIEVIKYLLTNQTERLPSNYINLVACFGHLEMLKSLLTERPDQVDMNVIIDEVAYHGHLSVIRYLLENTAAQCTHNTMTIAAEKGHLEIIKYLHFNRREACPQEALYLAVANKHFEVVKFIVEVIQIDIAPSSISLSELHRFEIFRYLYDRMPENTNVDPSTTRIDMFFSEEHDPSDFDWLKEKGFQFSNMLYFFADSAKSKVTFKWLHENTTHPIVSMHTQSAIISGHHSIVEYLNEVGAPFPQYPMDIAHDLQMLTYLHRNRTESCTIQAMDNAINVGDIQMIKYLKQNNFEIQQNNQPKLFGMQQNSLFVEYNSRLELIKSNNL
ncbi:hypothetical protein PPL_06648 [Heterostelium album PN500]|uniref:Ankyrin repeat-containing protein n=1 Tax=Heterostelium pallidum (strain ATCC 26659 / Pp 5 / PN500) TaxID=670386 RepID=D3BFB5_HETP5|nr:hypothetical protein PPL_06648 [Heterostelium album PN500]EFA79829.1 hypothetical protein PPL_06648 [Heterostelium album PN500]|eukprot:XP_020431950.1 hypothetical protein PPL_06648 [Heterostelium album PN500]